MTEPPPEVGDGSAPPQEESDEDGGGSPPMLEESDAEDQPLETAGSVPASPASQPLLLGTEPYPSCMTLSSVLCQKCRTYSVFKAKVKLHAWSDDFAAVGVHVCPTCDKKVVVRVNISSDAKEDMEAAYPIYTPGSTSTTGSTQHGGDVGQQQNRQVPRYPEDDVLSQSIHMPRSPGARSNHMERAFDAEGAEYVYEMERGGPESAMGVQSSSFTGATGSLQHVGDDGRWQNAPVQRDLEDEERKYFLSTFRVGDFVTLQDPFEGEETMQPLFPVDFPDRMISYERLNLHDHRYEMPRCNTREHDHMPQGSAPSSRSAVLKARLPAVYAATGAPDHVMTLVRDGRLPPNHEVSGVVPAVAPTRIQRFCPVCVVLICTGEGELGTYQMFMHRLGYRHLSMMAKMYGVEDEMLHEVMEECGKELGWCDPCYDYHSSTTDMHEGGKAHAKMVAWLSSGGRHRLLMQEAYVLAHTEPSDEEFFNAILVHGTALALKEFYRLLNQRDEQIMNMKYDHVLRNNARRADHFGQVPSDSKMSASGWLEEQRGLQLEEAARVSRQEQQDLVDVQRVRIFREDREDARRVRLYQQNQRDAYDAESQPEIKEMEGKRVESSLPGSAVPGMVDEPPHQQMLAASSEESKVPEEGDQLVVYADSDWIHDVDSSRRSQGIVLMDVSGTLDDEEVD
jgi:hypothetical protein